MPIRREESLSLRYPFRIPFSIRTVFCVGWPSSSTLSEPRRQGMVPLSTTVHFSLATRLPMRPANAEVCLAIEVGFESVADGFVQQDAGPAGAEDDFHFAGGRFARVELQDRLAGGFLGEVFGSLFTEEEVEGDASAAAGAAAGGSCLRSWRCRKRSCGPAAGSLRRRCRRNRPPGCCATRRSSWRELP